MNSMQSHNLETQCQNQIIGTNCTPEIVLKIDFHMLCVSSNDITSFLFRVPYLMHRPRLCPKSLPHNLCAWHFLNHTCHIGHGMDPLKQRQVLLQIQMSGVPSMLQVQQVPENVWHVDATAWNFFANMAKPHLLPSMASHLGFGTNHRTVS